jgi:phospholipid/cholesterol/gamma-HCH transport system permease protein
MFKKIVGKVGRFTISYLNSLGNLTIMSMKAFISIRKTSTYIDQVIESFIYIGRDSLPLLVTTSLFMGLVVGVQIGMQSGSLTPPWVEGGIILRLVLLEMGPIISGLVLAGRVSSGISSEIGEMNVTEQIDALRTTAIDPVEYLVMPRVLAGMFAVPILIIWGDIISILFGFVSTYFSIGLTWSGFLKGMRSAFAPTDVYTSIIKGFVFGIIMTLFGCYFGLQAKHGAKGVGRSTTYAVIWASIVIIVMDYIISAALFFVW